MSSKLVIPELKRHKEALDDLLEQLTSNAKVDLQKASAIVKTANAARAIVDSSLAVNLAKPELALIVEDAKSRRLTASDREWNGAKPKPQLARRNPN